LAAAYHVALEAAVRRRHLAAALVGLIAAISNIACHAASIEHITFASARAKLGPLIARRAAEANQPRSPDIVLNGYLVKPDGAGPFPAIVLLHGCNGLSASLRRAPASSRWVETLVGWGYAVLAFDSFAARDGRPTCSREVEFYRVADAFGALAFLARRRDIDRSRIAILGFSSGGIAALSAVEQRDYAPFELSSELRFNAAIAFSPVCVPEGVINAPALVLVGELDDWSPVARCRFMVADSEAKGAPIKLVVYPGVAHDFGDAALRPLRQRFGHFSAYNRAASEDAIAQVKSFLASTR
jgi:dienelactone hydrolase